MENKNEHANSHPFLALPLQPSSGSTSWLHGNSAPSQTGYRMFSSLLCVLTVLFCRSATSLSLFPFFVHTHLKVIPHPLTFPFALVFSFLLFHSFDTFRLVSYHLISQSIRNT